MKSFIVVLITLAIFIVLASGNQKASAASAGTAVVPLSVMINGAITVTNSAADTITYSVTDP